MELETIVENGHIEEELDLEKVSPPWSFGEWKDMALAEAEMLHYCSEPPRPLTPLPAGAEREFDEDEWEEMLSIPFLYSLHVLNLMGEEVNARKEDSCNRTENGEGSKKGKKKKKPRSQTKVILRRLPPTMTEGEFSAIMSPMPPYDYFHFCKADRSLGVHERTYVLINFISELDAHDFIERYHDCIFYDSKGNEYISVCHAAPNQTIPKENDKVDPLANTMKETQTYKDFLATYEESPETLFAIPVSIDGPITPEMMAEELEARPKRGPASTPLLDYIREENSKPTKQSSLASFKDAAYSKKSAIDKMRTIKKDKRKERRDRERKEKREKDVKSKKLKGKSYNDKKYDTPAGGSKDQDSSGPSSKSESNEASTSAKSNNPSCPNTTASKDSGDKRPIETSTTKESKFGKDFKGKAPPPSYSDKKPRTFKGAEPTSKLKDKTRWSKNSGLRTHYDDKLLGKSPDKKPSRSSKPDKPRRPSLVSEKEGGGSGKVTSIPETEEGSSATRLKPNSNDASKGKGSTPTTDSKPADSVSKDVTNDAKSENTAGPSNSNPTGKKVVIKKVIKKVRKVKADDNDMKTQLNNENPSGASSTPKKTASVKKTTSSSSKPREDYRPNSKSGGAGDAKDAHGEPAHSKNPNSEKHDSNKDSTVPNSSKDKEKRVRKGRPDLQIYRPGSLRSTATTTKPNESNANGSSESAKKEK